MESSSTTVNITGAIPIEPVTEVPNPKTIARHSHGQNFGRYVAGCPACIKKYPDGPGSMPKRRVRPDSKSARIAAMQKTIAELAAATSAPPPIVINSDAGKIASLQAEIDALRRINRQGNATTATDELVAIMLRQEAKKPRRHGKRRHAKTCC